ncbi:MAG: reprolysin-like metallopeptidase, partial [Saprospiraceae bacterium]
LVNNNDTLIFLDGNTDPYSNNNGGAMLNQNQTTCNNRIGNANYDIGHVFSTGGGGVAVLACVCSSGNKAKGVTGGSDPVGDAFDIDYVAHEMGHQFGCNHTFNGTHGSCNGNRSLPSAYEPGSGSTIMAYAGICDDQDVQPHSDAYFHAKSLLDAGAFVTGGGHTCDNEVITGNNAPTANAGADYTIPKSTPFVLTATGSDADGDPITYCWEQYNNGDSTQPPDGTDLDGPNFRSLIPTSEPKRYFPALGEVINNNNPTWEVLSSVGRTMNFRVTVRDNYGGAGCTKEDNMVLTVAGGAGPFEVTAPNTPVSWVGNTTRPVTWDVAGTAGAPVSSANVKISLSIDGGWTYPTVILASTPNDGIELITVPNTPSNNCRIKVEGVGNVFYDISDVDFIISAGLPVELLEFSARLQGKNGALLSWATASEKDNRGFEIQQATKNETKGLSFEPVGFVEGKGNSALRNDYGFELNELLPGEYYFRLRQIDFDGSESYSPVRSLLIKSDFLLMTRPNPVQNELEVQVFQETDAALHISIINQWGQEQELLSRQEVNKGETLWRFNLSNLPAGVYVLLVKRNQGMEERKLVIGYR